MVHRLYGEATLKVKFDFSAKSCFTGGTVYGGIIIEEELGSMLRTVSNKNTEVFLCGL